MDELIQELHTVTWCKSTRSGPDGGNCVEVAELSRGRRGVRDSKNPSGPALVFTPDEWNAFIGGVKNGDFD
ncbi:DUF397 domain-containing protein [Streptosporangium sp. NBC_01639]|uniref:DUF397 domain-containing protein n=1 Tax=unclassified Streptosporangium TaxID=2632669 RepID=UPI002DD8BF50|nr:DUF397 domain-containing protein [Streptosporangium sp. NBC_01756]WSC84549.1 DUF397 domain-containing protein [Streptosporangium sp. NBC_01756]WTD56818.1 DUF397 domain-containing protein [Streptosporangium sp. NBC_01639]